MPLVPDPQHPGAFRVVFEETSQSWVDSARPDLLLFEYVAQVSLLFEHGPADVGQGERIRVIHIGEAGLSIPRWIAWRRPGTAQIMYEPDARLTEKVRRKLPLPPRSDIKVRDVDGRSGVAAIPPDYADLVVLDTFGGARVPGELVTAEFLDELAKLGRGRRMAIRNVIDSSPFGWTRRFAAGLAERWRHLLVGTEPTVRKGCRFGNLLLATSGTRVDVTGLRRDSAKQPCPYRWIEGRELRSWIGGAEPFTDADMQDSPPPSGSRLWFS